MVLLDKTITIRRHIPIDTTIETIQQKCFSIYNGIEKPVKTSDLDLEDDWNYYSHYGSSFLFKAPYLPVYISENFAKGIQAERSISNQRVTLFAEIPIEKFLNSKYSLFLNIPVYTAIKSMAYVQLYPQLTTEGVYLMSSSPLDLLESSLAKLFDKDLRLIDFKGEFMIRWDPKFQDFIDFGLLKIFKNENDELTEEFIVPDFWKEIRDRNSESEIGID